jgi:hypothetical protein
LRKHRPTLRRFCKKVEKGVPRRPFGLQTRNGKANPRFQASSLCGILPEHKGPVAIRGYEPACIIPEAKFHESGEKSSGSGPLQKADGFVFGNPCLGPERRMRQAQPYK